MRLEIALEAWTSWFLGHCNSRMTTMAGRRRTRTPVRPVYGSALAALNTKVIEVYTAEQPRGTTRPARHSSRGAHHSIDHGGFRAGLAHASGKCVCCIGGICADQTAQRPSRNAARGLGLSLLLSEVCRGAPGAINADPDDIGSMTAILQTIVHMRAAYVRASLCASVNWRYAWGAYACPLPVGHMRSPCWRLALSVRVYRCITRPNLGGDATKRTGEQR